MIRSAYAVIASLVLCTPTTAEEPTSPPYPAERRAALEDLAKLQGTWVCILAENNGLQSASPGARTATYEGDRLTLRTDGEHYRSAVVTLDPGRSPKAMNTWDFDGPNRDQVLPGIYEIDGDKLRVCFAHPGKKRPAEFKADRSETGGFIYAVYTKAAAN